MKTNNDGSVTLSKEEFEEFFTKTEIVLDRDEERLEELMKYAKDNNLKELEIKIETYYKLKNDNNNTPSYLIGIKQK